MMRSGQQLLLPANPLFIWASLIVGALVMIYGWVTARPDIAPETAGQHTLTIYFVLLPAFMSLVLGAILGAWQHRMRVAP